MVDVASIVVAVISLIGALVAAGFTAWFTYFSDERKRLSEAENCKIPRPLLLASQDLQVETVQHRRSRPHELLPPSRREKGDLTAIYGFPSWPVHVLDLHLTSSSAVLRFSMDQQNRELTKLLNGITYEFSTDKYNLDGESLMLWRGQQMAIGESMTVKDDSGELFCMGYAAFSQRWAEDGPRILYRYPISDCEYNTKGFTYIDAQNRHVLTHYKAGKCSTCSATFTNAQEFYDHLEPCILRKSLADAVISTTGGMGNFTGTSCAQVDSEEDAEENNEAGLVGEVQEGDEDGRTIRAETFDDGFNQSSRVSPRFQLRGTTGTLGFQIKG